MSRSVRWTWVVVGALGAVGCGSDPPTTSTVKGHIAQDTFSWKVQRISVVSDKGAASVASVDAHGAFALVLKKGARYQFFLSEDGKTTPIVIKSDDGRLETALEVQSGGATVDIGSVRFWPGTSPVRSRMTSPGAPTRSVVSGTPTTGGSGACVGGSIEGTAQPCASGVAPLVCEDVDDEEGDDDGDNHECEDGIDPNGNSCDGGPEANKDDGAGGAQEAELTDASASDAVGVPALNLPEKLGCGDGEDGEEGDDD